METWKILKMLTENKNLQVIDTETGDRCWLDEQGNLVSAVSEYKMSPDGDWQLANVTVQEAMKAMTAGKLVECVLPGGHTVEFNSYRANETIPFRYITEGLWYIKN